VVRHTFIIFGLFTTLNLCPPDTKSWRRHWRQLSCHQAGVRGVKCCRSVEITLDVRPFKT